MLASRVLSMYADRATWIPHFRELSAYYQPRLGRFLSGDRNKGTKKNGSIINEAGMLAHESLTNNIFSGVTNPARRWFGIGVNDQRLKEAGDVRFWLDDVERIFYRVFEKSNFYDSVHSLFSEQSLFGTAAMLIDRDFDDIIRCKTFTAGQYAAATNSKNQLSAFTIEYDMTVEQMVDAFGLPGEGRRHHVSNAIANLYKEGDLGATRTIQVLWEENDDRIDVGLFNSEKWAYRCVFWEKGSKAEDGFYRVSGYRIMPVVMPRWDVVGEDVYGWSPAMYALSAVKGLQMGERRLAKQMELVGAPPVAGSLGLQNQPISLLPGGVTLGPDTQVSRPVLSAVYQINPRLGEMQAKLTETEERIRRAFKVDLFLLASQSNVQRTAREVEERSDEKLQALGPVMERQRNELLDPVIDILFDYALEAGILPDAPQSIAGQELQIDYISTLAQAQKSVGVYTIERHAQFVAGMVQMTGDPKYADKFDIDQAIDTHADLVGLPARINRSDEDVDNIRGQREQAQARQNQLDQAATGAAAAKDASQAQVEDGNLLERIIEGAQPVPQ